MSKKLLSENKTARKLTRKEKQRITIANIALIPCVIKNYIDTLVKVYRPTFAYQLKVEFFYYIVTTIIKRQNTYENKALENIPVALNATILRGIKSDYNEYIDWLIEQEIIFKAENYVPELSSNKYCFANFILPSLKEDSVSEIIEMKALESSTVIVARSIQESEVYEENKHLLKWFNDGLEIDFEGAKTYIKDLSYYEGEIFDLTHKKVHWNHQISTLHHKAFYATRNKESDFRLHTVLTNLKKIFKPFVTYEGQELVGYDLKNSQPFFLIFLINSIINNNDRISNILSRIYSIKDYNSFMLQKLREVLSTEDFQKEYEIFKTWVLNGEIYENMKSVMNPKKQLGSYFANKYNAIKKVTELKKVDNVRALMKGVIFTLFFSGIKTRNSNYKTFKKDFPNLIALIEIFKMKNNADFSKLLQNIESECIIDFVSKKIANEYPEIPLFSIHDSLSTTEKYAHILADLMPKYIFEYTGLMPKIEEERWKKYDYQIDYKRKVELHSEWYAYNGF
ncbi:hypothetical protein EG359_11190 [Chryseobacterium joostei]|uniref:DNA-directed RNA polymerase n=1 Tax=Chryseobacterium joostei TaxID=112234 RepID=A0A1N7IGY8_9FLAO|nr:hypothetical protein [Chryseobacterium joostei]AZB00153.1 hypothetical protein EG359_11190 [Chryseobacterium joostei]SIS36286.1 hypothetical protein SAMN05421768_105159 [Chryseobacterium joostei]